MTFTGFKSLFQKAHSSNFNPLESFNLRDQTFARRASVWLLHADPDQSWTFLEKIAREVSSNPPNPRISGTGNVVSSFLVACQDFVQGKLLEAAHRFGKLTRATPHAYFAAVCMRTFNKLGLYEEAIKLGQDWLARSRDWRLSMDVATSHFLNGNLAAANDFVSQAKIGNPDYFKKLTEENAGLAAELKRAAALGLTVRKEEGGVYKDIYDDEFVRNYWNGYYSEFTTHTRHQSNSGIIVDVMCNQISRTIGASNPDVFVDFGCGCAYPMYTLAKQWPGTAFCGVDRQEWLRKTNTERFGLPNTSFRAGEITDMVHSIAPEASNKMLCHVRTGIMIYPAGLRQLYRDCAKNGFRSVVLYEISSISAESQVFRGQGSGFPSESHRSVMFIHDYVSMLREAGFPHVHCELQPHGHGLVANNMLPGDTYVFIQAHR